MEIFDLYDKNRNKLDQTMERGTKEPDNTYRIVVHSCIFNSKGEMLIQKRSMNKKDYPGLYDLSGGGSVISGETSEEGIKRELLEELGLDYSTLDLRASLTINFPGGFDDFYIIKDDVNLSDITIQEEELDEVLWASIDEIINLINKKEFIPYNIDFIKVLDYLKNHKSVLVRK